jgi:hypothetical protein
MALPKLLQSSVDPSKISLTIKGLAVFIPAIIALAAFFGLKLEFDSLTELLNQLAVAGSALAVIWGLIRKLFVSKDETPQNPQ